MLNPAIPTMMHNFSLARSPSRIANDVGWNNDALYIADRGEFRLLKQLKRCRLYWRRSRHSGSRLTKRLARSETHARPHRCNQGIIMVRPVHERVPPTCRAITIVLGLIAVITAGSGGIKSCTFGQEKYSSQKQVNFLIAVGIIILIFLGLRIFAFDIKRRRLPSVMVQLVFDAVFALLAFSAAIAVAASPIGNEICYGDMKDFMEEACDFHCSNVIGSVVVMFLTFVGFLIDILFVASVIPVRSSAAPAEDFTFGEKVSTPRAAKAQANASSSPSASV